MSDPSWQLRDALLKKTVAWCRERSPFYRERLPASELGGLDELHRLPVLHRSEVVENHAALRCDDSLPAGVQHTTGTTGQFLQLYRGQAEQAFIWSFFASQMPAVPPDSVRPLHLSLSNAYHGSLIPMPSRAYVLSAGVHDRAQAGQARGLLERRYDLPGVESRVSVVTGTERMVMALTAYLLAEGYDFARSPIGKIALFGGHVPVSRKRLLHRIWWGDERFGEIKDHYSLTEMFGGARECGVGGPWVFDPHVVPEIVHPRTYAPVREGVGVLLLTSLFPFVQQMPLVRYFTGDLVEVVTGPEAPAGPSVRYVGRLARSVIDLDHDDVRPLLLSGPLYELLLALPDVAVSPRFVDLQVGVGLELTGDLHYRVDHSAASESAPEEITIQLGLRYAPWMYPDRVSSLIEELVAGLFERHPELSRRVTAGDLRLRVRPRTASEVSPHDSK